MSLILQKLIAFSLYAYHTLFRNGKYCSTLPYCLRADYL